MKIHEYQGKELLRKFGVPVPRGMVARSPEEAYQAANLRYGPAARHRTDQAFPRGG